MKIKAWSSFSFCGKLSSWVKTKQESSWDFVRLKVCVCACVRVRVYVFGGREVFVSGGGSYQDIIFYSFYEMWQ